MKSGIERNQQIGIQPAAALTARESIPEVETQVMFALATPGISTNGKGSC